MSLDQIIFTVSQFDEIVAMFAIYFRTSGRLAVRNSNRGGRILAVGFYGDTPRIPSGVNRVTFDGLTVAESRRNRHRRREHMTATGARWTGRRLERHGVNEHARRVQQLSSGGRPCCRSGGLLVLGARVLPLFGKTAAAAARSRARKIDGGLLRGEGSEMALERGGGLPNEYRNIARVNLKAAKQKGNSRQRGTIYRRRRQFSRYMRRSIKGREITIRKVTEGTVSHSNTDIKIYFRGFFPWICHDKLQNLFSHFILTAEPKDRA